MAQNFLLFPLASASLKLRYLEPAWSLAIELAMYVLLWLGMSRDKQTALFCLIFGTAYHVVLLANGADFSERYFGLASPLFSYALGASIYFHYDWLAKDQNIGAAAAVLWICNTVFGSSIWGEHVLDIGYYANSVLFGIAVPFLLEIKLGERMREHDELLGHLSYPLFLVQWLAGFVAYLALDGSEGRSFRLFLIAMPLAVLMAVPLMKLNALIVEPLRARLRRQWRRGADVDPLCAKTSIEPAR